MVKLNFINFNLRITDMPYKKKKHHPKITHPKFEYSKITENIIIGTNLCCLMHFNKELVKKGTSADVSLEAERLDTPFGVKYYLWIPVNDHQAPTQEQLMVGVDFLDYLVSKKVKIFVHCKNGHGRAPTLVAAYLIATKDMKLDQAIRFIEKRRPAMHLERVQYDALRKFAKSSKS